MNNEPTSPSTPTTSPTPASAPTRETILNAIEKNEIKPRSRAYFVLCGLLSIIGCIVVAISLMFMASLIVFSAERRGLLDVPAFGLSGWYAFFSSLPWLLIIGCLVFVAVLELLVRRHRFAYRAPLLYSVGGIFLLTLVAGWWVAKTPLHPAVSQYANEHRRAFLVPLYERFSVPIEGRIVRGQIEYFSDGGFSLSVRRHTSIPIMVNGKTRIIPPNNRLATGTFVVVFGQPSPEGMRATGIKIITPATWERDIKR